MTSGDNPDYNTTEIVENAEKSPKDFRRLDVTQTLLKDLENDTHKLL